VPSVATLISRAVARYLGVSAQTVAREIARAAAREFRGGVGESARSVPSVPAHGRLARGVFVVWLAGLALFALVVVNVDLFLPREVSNVFRLMVGLVLLIEGAGLLVQRWPFRTVLVARLTAGSLQDRSRIRRAAWKHVVGAGLTLLGVVWIAAGVFDLLRGAIALF
jgi:hypothetical protein